MKILKIFAASLLSLFMIGCSVSAETSSDDFQVDREELKFLYEFCSDILTECSYFSDEFAQEYLAVLESAENAVQNYSQSSGEEAYWNLFKELNKACVYSETPGDFNGSGVCDVNDCTVMQKCIAGIDTLDIHQTSKLGLNSGEIPTIITVTEMQKSIAGISVFENPESFEALKNNVETRDISVNNIFYQAYIERNEGAQANGIKIYLSPSNQDANIYAAGNTNEMIQCNRIAEAVEKYLLEHGFDVKRAPMNQDMYVTIDQSNLWGADLHVPIHTNALDGTHTGGTMVMVYDLADKENVAAARTILDSLSPITPGPDYPLVQRTDLRELSDIEAMSVYVECEYHDTAEGANFIINHINEIAEAISKGICIYYGIEW